MEPTAAPSSAFPYGVGTVRTTTTTSEENSKKKDANNVEIQSMGDVFIGNGANVEVLKSLESSSCGERVKQSLRFIVQVSKPLQENGSLILCYVDPRGKLHHYYSYEKRMDHDESTYTGDAFVAYHCTNTSESNKPTTVKQLEESNDCNVLCSYRVTLALADKYVHCVDYCFDDTPTVKVTAMTKPDDEYRVIVGLPKNHCRLPPPDESWEVRFEYACPPLPTVSKTWSKKKRTFYVWGDLDFDDYGASHFHDVPAHLRTIHPCRMNQIVPQVMIGNCLASNTPDEYKPSWVEFDEWVIQAQYYWQASDNDGHALCGTYIPVTPGDLIRTRICYNAETGSMDVSIAVVKENGEEEAEKRSDISIPQPFMHGPSLFESWKDFFEKCVKAEQDYEKETNLPSSKAARVGEEASSPSLRGVSNQVTKLGARARPGLNVEYKGRVDIETLKTVCPFVVKEATYPGLPSTFDTSKWTARLYCPRTGRVDVLHDATKTKSLSIEDAVTLG